MLNKIFNKPLELKIGDQTLQFNSVAEIVFCLEGRTSVSSTKLAELLKMPIDQLEEQQKKIEEINKSLLTMLNEIIDKPDNIDRSMRELDTQIFSQDHGWREIIQALNKVEGGINDIRTAVLTKYMKYLSTAEDTVKHICEEKKRYARDLVKDVPEDLDATWAISQLRKDAKKEIPTDDNFKQLPKNQKVSVNLSPGEKIDIRLASYPCQLAAMNDSINFIDNNGTTSLMKGQNTIGRSVKCSVQIDPNQRHVSRRHLHVLVTDGHILQLTDTSSEGTFINSDFIT